MKIRLSLTLTIHKDPAPDRDGGSARAPDIDEKASIDLTRRPTPDTQLGFQPRDVEA